MGATALLALVFAIYVATAQAATYTLAIPPREQWENNYGYCGEVSMISAGLYYGQYCSQYKARSLATPGVNQSKAASQLLVGSNAKTAATAMKLKSTEYTLYNVASFMAKVKAAIIAGNPVIIGIFMNYNKFYQSPSGSTDGDSDYDHIVPVTGVTGVAGVANNADTITFSDNDEWWHATSTLPQFTFQSTFGAFARSRSQANLNTSPPYSLNKAIQYGITINGVADTFGNTVPVRLTTSVNVETPEIVDGSGTAPAPSPITLTATVTIPNQTVAYKLYLYNDFAKVPTSAFNSAINAAKATRSWSIPANQGPTYVVTITIQSNEVAVFRAVKATAP